MSLIREEFGRLTTIGEHTPGQPAFFTETQLLTVSSSMNNPLTPTGRFVDVILEAWALVVVAGSAGAVASFCQSIDRS